MTSADTLSSLRDVRLPAPPDGAPLLPFVGIAFILLLLALGGILLLVRRRNGWIREAEQALGDLGSAPPDIALSTAAGLLRRIALARIGADGSKLRGEPWLEALDRLFGTDFFRHGAGRVFGDALYRPGCAPANAPAALAGLRHLLRRRRLRPW